MYPQSSRYLPQLLITHGEIFRILPRTFPRLEHCYDYLNVPKRHLPRRILASSFHKHSLIHLQGIHLFTSDSKSSEVIGCTAALPNDKICKPSIYTSIFTAEITAIPEALLTSSFSFCLLHYLYRFLHCLFSLFFLRSFKIFISWVSRVSSISLVTKKQTELL